jgi:hypothetical protein
MRLRASGTRSLPWKAKCEYTQNLKRLKARAKTMLCNLRVRRLWPKKPREHSN